MGFGPNNNILIISASDPYRTAGIAAYNIFLGLKQSRHSVELIVQYASQSEPGVKCLESSSYSIRKIIHKVMKLLRSKLFYCDQKFEEKYHFHQLIESHTTIYAKILRKCSFTPNIIIIVFAQDFISFKDIYFLQKKTNARIIWQLADMAPLTGGCHYAWDCIGYTSCCESCVAVSKKYQYKVLKQFKSKLKYIKKTKIELVIGSNWLIERAQKSTLFLNAKIRKIYLAQETELFQKLNAQQKSFLQKSYLKTTGKKILLIAANDLLHERKGIKFIFDALSKAADSGIVNRLFLLIVGRNFANYKNFIGYDHLHIEKVERGDLPLIYQLADVYVSASMQDVGPYMLTEALLSGVPVISFDCGYADDFVTEKTGYLCENNTSDAILKGIKWFLNLNENEYQMLSKQCRTHAEKLVSFKKINDEWSKLLENSDERQTNLSI